MANNNFPPQFIGGPGIAGAGLTQASADMFGNINGVLQQLILSKLKQKQASDLLGQELMMKLQFQKEMERQKHDELANRTEALMSLLPQAETATDMLQAYAAAGFPITPDLMKSVIQAGKLAEDDDLKKQLLKSRIELNKKRTENVGKGRGKDETPSALLRQQNEFYKLAENLGFDPRSPQAREALAALKKNKTAPLDELLVDSKAAQVMASGLDKNIFQDESVKKRLTPEELKYAKDFQKKWRDNPTTAVKTFQPIMNSIISRLNGEDQKALQEKALRKQERWNMFKGAVDFLNPFSGPVGQNMLRTVLPFIPEAQSQTQPIPQEQLLQQPPQDLVGP